MHRHALPAAALLALSGAGFAQEAPGVRWKEDDLRFELTPEAGFRMYGEAEEPLLHVGGVLALDYTGYDSRNSRPSQVRLDRAVARVEGRYRDLDWRIATDFRGVDTQYGLEEAWASYWPTDLFRTTVGLQKIPLTIDDEIQQEQLPFIGYAFPAYIDDRTDLALRFDGEIESGLLSYAATATAGVGFDKLGYDLDGYQLSAAVTAYPFRRWAESDAANEGPSLAGFFVMGSYAYTIDYGGPVIVANPFRNRLFKVGNIDADSASFYNVGYGADLGPFRFAHEWITGGYRGVDLPGGGTANIDGRTTGWSACGSWMLTGETYDSRPFRLRKGQLRSPVQDPLLWGRTQGIGALELAVRYSNGDIDRDFFRLGFTNYTTSSQEFRSFDVALNWYPISNMKAAFQLVRTIADQYPQEIGGHGRDTSFFFRLQYTF